SWPARPVLAFLAVIHRSMGGALLEWRGPANRQGPFIGSSAGREGIMRTKGLVNRNAPFFPLAMLLLPLIGGCGSESPPYAELPLRDALSAAPEVLASLPQESLHDLAVRLEEAQTTSADQSAPASSDIPSV